MGDEQLVQLIDGEGNLAEAAAVARAEEFLGLRPETGNDYFVAAVLGAQSSGKSTLLNLLFDTELSLSPPPSLFFPCGYLAFDIFVSASCAHSATVFSPLFSPSFLPRLF
jgi:hypothetical protein